MTRIGNVHPAGPDIDPREHWSARAACAGMPPALWHSPLRDGSVAMAIQFAVARQALEVCGGCPVWLACRADADATHARGVIRGRRVYDADGHHAPACQVCYQPVLDGDPRSTTCENHRGRGSRGREG